jgi:phosphoglycolate phosphatase
VNVLFDLDGTVIDSSPGIYACFEYALDHVGVPPLSRQQLKQYIGPPLERTFPVIAPEASDAALEAYRDRYARLGYAECSLYDGIVDAIDTIIDAGHILAIATAKIEHATLQVLDHLGITDRFAVIAATRPDIGRSAKPEVVRFALEQLGDADAVLIGDRIHDVEGADDNDIDCIGVLWGFGDAGELSQCVAIAEQPDELAGIVSALSVGPTARMATRSQRVQ